MKIVFTAKTAYTVADLIRLAGTEGVGYEMDFWSNADLFLVDEGRLVRHRRGHERVVHGVAQGDANLNPDDTVLSNGGAYAPEFLRRGPTWVTAWSGFAYQLMGNDPNGRQSWLYEGAQNGFLAQTLLPPLPEVIVLSVEGTYGTFTGPDALERYKSVKSGWYRLWWPIYEGLQGRVLPHTNGWGGSAFIAEMWRRHGGVHTKAYLGEALAFDSAESYNLCREVLTAAFASLSEMEAQDKAAESA